MTPPRKTKAMLRVEKEHDEKLEKLLPRLLNEHGAGETARRLGQSKGGLSYWLARLHITYQRVACGPDEEIIVRKRK